MTPPGTHRLVQLAAGAAGLLLTAPDPVGAQPQVVSVPQDTEGIGIFEKLDTQIPLDLRFTAESGRAFTLSESFSDGKPVLLTLVYYECPSICNALLNGLTETLKALEWSVGDQFRVITVSIDPTESHELAAAKKRGYLSYYGRAGSAEEGWQFLVGEQPSIEALAEAVGFGYRYEEGTGLYTHAASVMVLTPGGRMSRYLNDVMYEPQTLQLALTEAAEGAIGTPVQRFLLKWCYSYDPTSGKYVLAARKVMTIGGGLMVLATVVGLVLLSRRELKRKDAGGRGRTAPEAAAGAPPESAYRRAQFGPIDRKPQHPAPEPRP